MAELPLTEGLRVLDERTTLARIFIFLFFGGFGLTLLTELGELAGVVDLQVPSPLTLAVALINLAGSLIYIASVVFISMWIYRAHANLFVAGIDGLEYTPGWSVGWFFIPFANLVKPYQAMRELWNASHDSSDSFMQSAPGELSAWWGCFIVGNILGNISFRLQLSGDTGAYAVSILLGAMSSAVTLASAFFLLRIVEAVTAAQHSQLGISKTFA